MKYIYYDLDGFHLYQNEDKSRYQCSPNLRNEIFEEMSNREIPKYGSIELRPDITGKPEIHIILPTPEDIKEIFRFGRNKCFNIINRGNSWYNTLTDIQIQELQIWYQEWLDAPDTLKEPIKPKWLI